jgi:hypothetical protein
MTERLHPVRQIHQHLRRAASLLEQRQLDAASAEVEAALAIDPASLTARTLQEKIRTERTRPALPQWPSAPVTLTPADWSDAAATNEDRFIPSGVDAQTWLGFEQRIQERRFQALLDTIAAALRAGDAVGAQLALEEARELRPDAPELESAADQLTVLPLLAPAAAQRRRASTRTLGAVSLLASGVALLVGLDAIRPDDTVAPAGATTEPVTAPVPPRADIGVPRMAEVPIPLLPAATADGDVVGTVGVRPALAIEPRVLVTEPILRPVTLIERALPVGEIPDDYVAPAVRDVPAAASQPARTFGQPLREVMTPPPPAASPVPSAAPPLSASASGVASPVVTPATPPAATPAPSAIVPPRVDENGVTQALNQYARAYGRLDASAARAVWPTVDERALARAFAGLESQNVSFENCDIDVRGATANASCRGQASYVGKVGNRSTRTEARQWRFELRRDGDAWKIETAEARRVSSY